MNKSNSLYSSSPKTPANRCNSPRFWQTVLAAGFCLFLTSNSGAELSQEPLEEDNIEIIAGEDRTVFEYRQNGKLVAIKVVPKVGKPYYLVPSEDGGIPRDLEHARHLYPQWIILEW